MKPFQVCFPLKWKTFGSNEKLVAGQIHTKLEFVTEQVNVKYPYFFNKQ